MKSGVNAAGSKTKDLLSIQEPGSPLENISEADEIRWAARKSLEAER